VTLTLLAAAPKGPLDTWSPTLIALFALLLPVIALAIILAFTIDSRRLSLAISVLFTAAAAICALLVVVIELAHPLHLERNSSFLQFFTGQSGAASEFTLQWGVLADPLAATMMIPVIFCSLFVQIYGLAFVRREDGPIRLYCVLLFATFATLGVILSTTYFEMLFFFGMVSVSIYLMVGHWWQRPESIGAAALAFIVSVIGDVALLAATAYIFFRFNELNFQTLAGQYTGGKVSANGLFIMSALLFIAAAAKSAQFPFHGWLSASTQAPAPVAALLHSAGGVLCGVYLIARSYALFHSSPRGLALLAIAGGVTALVGVLLALVQGNLKRAIAYTTVGELGLMVLALGISAYGASVFEAFAQAWPKALLFLGAGIVIRELRSERLADMGGLWRRMPFTGWLMLIGVAAAAGVPPFSTFWSKDTILSKALAIKSGPAIVVVVAVTLFGALALVRVFCLAFTGETARRRRFEPERIRDSTGRAALGMVLLAIPSVAAGIRGIPGRNDPIAFVTFPRVPIANSHLVAAGLIAIAALIGAALAWLIYARRVPVPSLQPVSPRLADGLEAERGYRLVSRAGISPLSSGIGWVDRRLLTGGGDLLADSLAFAGRPRRWLVDLWPGRLAIGVMAGIALLALAAVLFGSRLTGTA
jgi:NADH-quinone oxidoreductase subunit L